MASLLSTGPPPLHPLVEAAAQGELPAWATASPARREHMARVAKLLKAWAGKRDEPLVERARWTAVGYLHDSLRDSDEEGLRGEVAAEFRLLPAKVLHGPAAALRLRREGVEDEELLHAIAFHTLGSPGFGPLGMALFAADFLEPGRTLKEKWRATLRDRAPGDLDGVVREILEARIRHLIRRGRPLRPETVAFWNRMSEGEGWASASEL
jgi:HD superfamily phosphohydrolase YqeK